MKNKSTRHKDFNTFKFQPFSERIANIDIDIFHKVGHEYEFNISQDECYFYQAVQNWNTLNLSESYESFKKEIKIHDLITLPLLILNKDRVVEVLLKHLKLKNPLSLQPLLNIVVALVKDLSKDFFPYYQQFFEVLIDLLNTKETEQLDWTFTCLAYIFKYLWRPLTKDFGPVFNTLLPLLSSSRPDYINNFAASSFAFVARKVKNRSGFLSHILKKVKSTEDGIEGCGVLFFEVIHGVVGQFHSCAESILNFLLESLSDPKLPQSILFEILGEVVKNITLKIKPRYCQLFYDTLINQLENLLTNWKNNQNNAEIMELDLKLLGQSIEYKKGILLKNPKTVIKQVIKLLSTENLPNSVVLITIQIAILLLKSENLKLSQEDASEIIRKVSVITEKSGLLYFIENTYEFPSFEALILPHFLKYCLKTNLNNECLHILTKLILRKSPVCQTGINLNNWIKYNIDFNGRQNNLIIQNILLTHLKIEDFNDLDCYICSLICLPHLNLIEKDGFVDVLTNNIKLIVGKIIENCQKKILFLLNYTIECLIHISNDVESLFYSLLDCILPLSVNEELIFSLKIVDLLITNLENNKNIINMAILEKLNDVLEVNFSSPHHEIRQITSHIYTFFEHLPEFQLKHSQNPDILPENFQIFSIIHKVETIIPQVDTYRDQLQNLQKFNYDQPQMIMCQQTQFKKIPLRYLCGCLYNNFKLLWDPVIRIIETLAHGLEIDVFWHVFGNEIKQVVRNIREEKAVKTTRLGLNCVFLEDLYEDSLKLSVRPDFVNYRLLLWKAMMYFTDVAEAKTRDISDLLLDLVEVEFTKTNSDFAKMWNIKQNSPQIHEESLIEKNTSKGSVKSGNIKNLLTHLLVFSRIRSPKSMYRKSELYKLYLDLLQHKNPEIQKVAFDCIMTYKQKFLVPYKENLYNLIDDKKFKNEITNFQISKDNSTILEKHREDLIPIIMKIVFSKMMAKVGLRTGGRSLGQLRRNLIFRFLAGCKKKEMLTFTQMTFRYYTNFFEENPELMVDKISNGVDLEKFIPPKRLKSTINLVNVILEQLGGLMGNDLLNFLLKIILVIGAVIKGVFQQSCQVHAGYLLVLRNLRTSCIGLIERFFSQFDYFPWTSEQINSIFSVFVWPYIDKLNIEGIHSPTTLLKLFSRWGSNARYFPLLIKHDKNKYVLPFIMKLLLNDKSHYSVITLILEMIENLLSLEMEEGDLQVPVDNLLPIRQEILDQKQLTNKLNYGSCILLPHVPEILEKIRIKLEKTSKNLSQRELFILTRISELVWEADISDLILKLLLPMILKKSSIVDEQIMQQFLTTVYNLLKNVSDPKIHLKQISPLFSKIMYPSGRKLLINILKISSDSEISANLVEELNAWDAKWVDQPDFQRRHDAFKQIQKLQENPVSVKTGILLIYNCFYLLKNEKDLSLRENSLYCLKNLCPNLLKNHNSHKDLDYILNQTLFLLIKQGMRSENDDFRNDCISLLGHLARQSPESHPVLRDLNKFTNQVDLEVDFFENICHLQIHRHARALLKFSQIIKEQTCSLNTRTMTQFILPLACFYLFKEKYVGKNSIIDASIECVGTVCHLLSWHQYEKLLKFCLEKLRSQIEYQKQLIRLIVAILDAFHFNLSKAQLDEITEKNIEHEEIIDNQNEQEEIEVDNVLEEENKEVDDVLEEENEEVDIFEEENEEEVDDVLEEENEEEVGKIYEKTNILCKSTATRVIKTIQVTLLPQLYKSMAELTQYDISHKINRKKTSYEREEEDLLRVPISLAVVKLLQKLPKEILTANLPRIFMKLCTFLKSHLESVRRVSRETLQKIMQTLGPEYLHLLLSEMTALLNRGYQVHVLVYTTHAILHCLKELYKPTDLDKILLTVLRLCKADLFGILSEEREVSKIVSKTAEAKSTKSFDTLQILAQFITDKCLMDLLLPIKQVLESSDSYKTIHKSKECLKHIVFGLVDNNFISTESILKFAYGMASESITELMVGNEKLKTKDHSIKEKTDCFIIPKAPVGRYGIRESNVRKSSKTNAHLLVEFGLRLCFVLLKREKVKDDDFRPFMDPFVPIFKKCLNSKHVKLSTLTLQCLSWVLKYDLPSIHDNIAEITEDILTILHKYASNGLSKGDNFNLVMEAFKTMSVLVRDVKYCTINTDQLKILLLYAEKDLHDHDRRATAFSLLKAIILHKLIIPEIHDVMEKVAELSILAELNHVRSNARVVFHQYLMDYPLGDRLNKYIGFYIAQLEFEMQYGRESAIEMIHNLISCFPLNTLIDYCEVFLVNLGLRLVNEKIPELKEMVSGCLTLLVTRLPKVNRDDSVLHILFVWFRSSDVLIRCIAAQLCIIIVTIEKASFETRLPEVLRFVKRQFNLDDRPGRFVRINRENSEDESTDRNKHHLYHVILELLKKICEFCPSFLKMNDIEMFANHAQTLLEHPNEEVRLSAVEFIGIVIGTIDIDHLANLLLTDTREAGYLYRNPVYDVALLASDLFDQLQTEMPSKIVAQSNKNLMFITRVVENVPIKDKKRVNLLWLARKMKIVVNTEIAETPTITILRNEVFIWIAAVATMLKLENILPILVYLLAPLAREMETDETSNAPLKQVAKEVADVLKKRVGIEVYTSTLMKVQQNLSVKRAERKRQRSQLAVTNPEIYAKNKMRRQEKKKESKKRKMANRKGNRNFKRQKVNVDMDPLNEV